MPPLNEGDLMFMPVTDPAIVNWRQNTTGLTGSSPSPTMHAYVSTIPADVQAVFVVPRLRNLGVGGRLIGRLLSVAREAGAEHVTVHSSADAVTAYERAGFSRDPLMLNQAL